MEIRPVEQNDYDQVSAIYRQGIATGIATFQTEVPGWNTWNEGHLITCRIAAFEGQAMTGWAALSPVSARSVYAGVAEVSIYISPVFRGKRIGKILLNQLIKESEQNGIWTLQSGIFSENTASISLHESCGFRKVGYREKVGNKDGVWKDNVIMERRSRIVGI